MLKNIQTKYNILELIASDEECTYAKLIGCMAKKEAVKLYGDIQVLSVKEYPDTCTSSIILKDNPNIKGFVINFKIKENKK
jgi:hypothetical protein